MKQFNLESWRSYDEAMADVKKALKGKKIASLERRTGYRFDVRELE